MSDTRARIILADTYAWYPEKYVPFSFLHLWSVQEQFLICVQWNARIVQTRIMTRFLFKFSGRTCDFASRLATIDIEGIPKQFRMLSRSCLCFNWMTYATHYEGLRFFACSLHIHMYHRSYNACNYLMLWSYVYSMPLMHELCHVVFLWEIPAILQQITSFLTSPGLIFTR